MSERCQICGGVTMCPVRDGRTYAAEIPDIPWRPAAHEIPPAPAGYTWERMGRGHANRVRAHGGATVHCGPGRHFAAFGRDEEAR